MENDKKKRLEQKGWVVGDTKNFLQLSNEEMKIIEENIKEKNKVDKFYLTFRFDTKDIKEMINSFLKSKNVPSYLINHFNKNDCYFEMNDFTKELICDVDRVIFLNEEQEKEIEKNNKISLYQSED